MRWLRVMDVTGRSTPLKVYDRRAKAFKQHRRRRILVRALSGFTAAGSRPIGWKAAALDRKRLWKRLRSADDRGTVWRLARRL